jgi:two-component system, NarL family, invasion response regulator UvrY
VIRVLIADDHAIFQRGLREILARSLKDVICGEAENAHRVLIEVQAHNWDLVILDISMPGRSGLDVLDDLRRVKPKLPVLILSMHPEDHYATLALKAGAAGYVTKGSSPEELIKAIHKALNGGRYVTPALAEKLAADLRDDASRAPHEALSGREFEIFRMIGYGKTVGQIAAELHLSITTVSTYRGRILDKMNIGTNADIIRYALLNHLID